MGTRGNSHLIILLGFVIVAGCSRTWEVPRLRNAQAEQHIAAPEVCSQCHDDKYDTWKKTAHADMARMDRNGMKPFHGCNACHSSIEGHPADPFSHMPVNMQSLTTSEVNELCGKCHFDQQAMGDNAFNPYDRHALFMSVGFDSQKERISCLDCHTGHSGRSHMLKSIQAHVCFSCHKEAIVTMGVFQPFNYAAGGRLCFGCHTIHGGTTAGKTARFTVGVTALCVACHPTLNLEKTWF